MARDDAIKGNGEKDSEGLYKDNYDNNYDLNNGVVDSSREPTIVSSSYYYCYYCSSGTTSSTSD